MAKARKTTKRSKASKIMPFCACGCGVRTKGGSFRMGHDQRLRGMLKRAEPLKAITKAFVADEGGEWAKLAKAGKASPKARKARKAQRSVQRASTPRRPRSTQRTTEAPAAPVSQS